MNVCSFFLVCVQCLRDDFSDGRPYTGLSPDFQDPPPSLQDRLLSPKGRTTTTGPTTTTSTPRTPTLAPQAMTTFGKTTSRPVANTT